MVAAGVAHTRGVAVCGAMANDPLAAALLLGMGLRELSMEASAIPVVKESLTRITVAEAEQVARLTLNCVTAEEAHATVTNAFAGRFADLLDTTMV